MASAESDTALDCVHSHEAGDKPAFDTAISIMFISAFVLCCISSYALFKFIKQYIHEKHQSSMYDVRGTTKAVFNRHPRLVIASVFISLIMNTILLPFAADFWTLECVTNQAFIHGHTSTALVIEDIIIFALLIFLFAFLILLVLRVWLLRFDYERSLASKNHMWKYTLGIRGDINLWWIDKFDTYGNELWLLSRVSVLFLAAIVVAVIAAPAQSYVEDWTPMITVVGTIASILCIFIIVNVWKVRSIHDNFHIREEIMLFGKIGVPYAVLLIIVTLVGRSTDGRFYEYIVLIWCALTMILLFLVAYVQTGWVLREIIRNKHLDREYLIRHLDETFKDREAQVTLTQVLSNKDGFIMFMDFLVAEYSTENLLCYVECTFFLRKWKRVIHQMKKSYITRRQMEMAAEQFSAQKSLKKEALGLRNISGAVLSTHKELLNVAWDSVEDNGEVAVVTETAETAQSNAIANTTTTTTTSTTTTTNNDSDGGGGSSGEIRKGVTFSADVIAGDDHNQDNDKSTNNAISFHIDDDNGRQSDGNDNENKDESKNNGSSGSNNMMVKLKRQQTQKIKDQAMDYIFDNESDDESLDAEIWLFDDRESRETMVNKFAWIKKSEVVSDKNFQLFHHFRYLSEKYVVAQSPYQVNIRSSLYKHFKKITSVDCDLCDIAFEDLLHIPEIELKIENDDEYHSNRGSRKNSHLSAGSPIITSADDLSPKEDVIVTFKANADHKRPPKMSISHDRNRLRKMKGIAKVMQLIDDTRKELWKLMQDSFIRFRSSQAYFDFVQELLSEKSVLSGKKKSIDMTQKSVSNHHNNHSNDTNTNTKQSYLKKSIELASNNHIQK